MSSWPPPSPPSSPERDEAVPMRVSALPSPAPSALWGGRSRRLFMGGCWGVAAIMLAVGVLPVALGSPDGGADSPDEAVEQLLTGIAELDVAAALSALEPDERRDPEATLDAYDQLEGNLMRVSDVGPSPDVARLATALASADQLDASTLALLADYDGELTGLDLDVEEVDDNTARVYIRDGVLDASVNNASYAMELAQGWEIDGVPLDPYLVVTEQDGRWFVSLEATADHLIGGAR